MGRRVITGFQIKSSDMLDVEMIMNMMRYQVEKIANKQFKKMLEEECERIVDEAVLGMTNPEEGRSIFQAAREEVIRKVTVAMQNGDNSEYNLSIHAAVYGGKEKDGSRCTFIRITAPNDIYSKEMTKKIKDLMPYHVEETSGLQADPNNTNKKEEVWNSIMEHYENDIPLGCHLFSFQLINVKPEDLQFSDIKTRAATAAQEHVLNCLLDMYAGRQQIQPHKLMEYMIRALKRLDNPDIVNYQKEKEQELIRILPEITTQMITSEPGIIRGS